MGHENWTVESPTFRGHPRILQIIQGSWMSSTLELTQFCDGSAYLSHMERIRGARGQALDESIYTTPLMYQGVSDKFLIWCAMIQACTYENKTDLNKWFDTDNEDDVYFELTDDVWVANIYKEDMDKDHEEKWGKYENDNR